MPKVEPKLTAPFLGFTTTAEIWNSRACMIGLIGTFIVELVGFSSLWFYSIFKGAIEYLEEWMVIHSLFGVEQKYETTTNRTPFLCLFLPPDHNRGLFEAKKSGKKRCLIPT